MAISDLGVSLLPAPLWICISSAQRPALSQSGHVLEAVAENTRPISILCVRKEAALAEKQGGRAALLLCDTVWLCALSTHNKLTTYECITADQSQSHMPPNLCFLILFTTADRGVRICVLYICKLSVAHTDDRGQQVI